MFSSLLLKHHHQNVGHEIDQIGAYRCVQRHGSVSFRNQHVQKLRSSGIIVGGV
jgi:hypothetical protein